jgi:hypothetical protein
MIYFVGLGQVYASTVSCDPSLNLTNLTNCHGDSRSVSTPSTADNSETFLIIPDILPTNEDLGDGTTGRDLATDADDSADSSKNSRVESPDTGRDLENAKDSSNNEAEENDDNDDDSSLVPFP